MFCIQNLSLEIETENPEISKKKLLILSDNRWEVVF